MTRWTLLLALLLMASPARGWTTDLLPDDAARPSLVRVDYERPWGGLPVSRGRLRAGLPLPAGLRAGAVAATTRAGTVDETAIGGWLSFGRAVHLSADRVSQSIEGLPTASRLDLAGSLRAGSGPFAVGWSVLVRDARSPSPAVWRTWWVGVEHEAARVSVGRRLTPWATDPVWIAAFTLVLPGAVEAGMSWRGEHSVLGLRWDTTVGRVAASSSWSGPRAGGFGFSLEAGAP
jgi:hypothetical protein